MMLLDASETLKRLEQAVAEARAFFGIDPLIDVPVKPEGAVGNAPCHITIKPGSMYRPISVDLDYFQRYPELIRESMAHEVAHLVTDEVACVLQRLPPEFSERDQPMAQILVDALETATVRLERLFMRQAGVQVHEQRITVTGDGPALARLQGPS